MTIPIFTVVDKHMAARIYRRLIDLREAFVGCNGAS